MVPPDRMYVYCWDVRPYPAFPADEDRWGDAANWATGHWLSGRVTRSELRGIVATLLADMGSTTPTRPASTASCRAMSSTAS